MPDGYDASKSRIGAAKLAEFLAAEVSEDLKSVPGIKEAGVEILATEVEGDQAITTTHQLIGKFLTLKGAGVSQQEHCDAMWYWLQSRKINSSRSGIVKSIAEKVNIMIPGIYSNTLEDN
mmetsp:Transcript_12884/g.22915  ORF Transcript_12884/g.22915 Transcript_12884/m.22915 type:complete len:120 (-) Transcript_12884:116-475(-)